MSMVAPDGYPTTPGLTLGQSRQMTKFMSSPCRLRSSASGSWTNSSRAARSTTSRSAVRLTGRLDVAALRRALNEIVRRHEALRTDLPSGCDGRADADHRAQRLAAGRCP